MAATPGIELPAAARIPSARDMRLLIAFDVDGTLIDGDGRPRGEVIALLKALSETHSIIVWSERGGDYAAEWGARLGLDQHVREYCAKHVAHRVGVTVDIAIDDEALSLGTHNIALEPAGAARRERNKHRVWL